MHKNGKGRQTAANTNTAVVCSRSIVLLSQKGALFTDQLWLSLLLQPSSFIWGRHGRWKMLFFKLRRCYIVLFVQCQRPKSRTSSPVGGQRWVTHTPKSMTKRSDLPRGPVIDFWWLNGFIPQPTEERCRSKSTLNENILKIGTIWVFCPLKQSPAVTLLPTLAEVITLVFCRINTFCLKVGIFSFSVLGLKKRAVVRVSRPEKYWHWVLDSAIFSRLRRVSSLGAAEAVQAELQYPVSF